MFWSSRAKSVVFLIYVTCAAFTAGAVGETLDVCASCHVNATCDEASDGRKVCNCMYGFVGNGRTHCQDKDECQIGASKICGNHTACHNTYGSFFCTCLSGYRPSNNMAAFIPNDGTFCDDINECQIQGVCGEGGQCRNVPGSFDCRCQEGYRVQNGSEPFTPNLDGSYCEAVDCGLPPNVTRARLLSFTGTRYLSQAVFGCFEGFFWKSGDKSAVCGAKGTWKGPSLVCEVDCGDPPSFPHAVMLWNHSTRMGAEVQYQCAMGYYDTGDRNFSNCTSMGHWSSVSVLCAEIRCGAPPDLPFARRLWNGSTDVASQAEYYCNEGSLPVGGENVSVCTGRGSWTDVTLQCKEVDCGEPPSFPHTVMLWNQSTRMGAEVLHQCIVGFYNAGKGNVSHCNANGYWDPVHVLCQEVDCGEPPSFPHTVMLWNQSTRMGAEVLYQCIVGFYNAGDGNVSQCNANGYWDPVHVLCQEVDCGEPPSFPHTVMLWNQSTRMGAEVLYQCIVGFYNAGDGNVSHCNANGYWDPVHVLCQEVDCGEPPSFPHTTMLWNQSTRMGAEVLYQCIVGFYNAGDGNVSHCNANGYWDPVHVLCQEVDCGEPPSFPHSIMLWNQSTRMGAEVLYQCIAGHYNAGDGNVSRCTTRGQWSSVSVLCTALCGPAPLLPHTVVLWQNGTMALHRCQDGYRSWKGSNVSQCGHAQTWHVATLHCRQIKPAISKLEVFNDRCLRWKADTFDGTKEHYIIQFEGTRAYQRKFQDRGKRTFTSGADRPEFCMRLMPGTNYTIKITAQKANYSLTIIANTSIQAPPAPSVTFRDVEGPSPILRLRRATHTLDAISAYQVFVLRLKVRLVFDCSSPHAPHFYTCRAPCREYVAAQIPLVGAASRLSFAVGDGQWYGNYYNAPLKNGKDYYVILRAVSQWGGVRKQSCVIWAKVRGTPYIIQSVTLVVTGSVGLVAFIVFVGHSCVWYTKKRLQCFSSIH